MSNSQKLREEGNVIYKSVTSTDGLCPAVRICRLEKARNLYYRASNVSNASNDEKSSAAKNIAMCEWRLGNVTSDTNEKPSLIVHHFLEALKNFRDALSYGDGIKPMEWTQKVSEFLVSCFRDVEKFSMDLSTKDRVKVMNKIVPHINLPHLSADIYLQIAQAYFHTGIKALEEKDHKSCLYQMAETNYPINECERLSKSLEFLSEVAVLREDVRMHTCMAESVQARATGDSLLQNVLKDQESLNMEMIWDIIDWYRSAMLLTRDLDMEAEAIAASRLGRVYDKVLKLKVQAKQYYRQAISLAESMHPRTFNNCDWYQESAAVLKRYQEETVLHEQEQQEKETQKYKEELKEEFKELNDKHDKTNNIAFLKFVYTRFPPKNPQNKLPAEMDGVLDHKAVKKLLQTAVVHYHPDRADPDKNGMKWKVLSEQITKYLTNRYEVMKAV
ncbi:hypothetical protein FSP39_004187 [Pinctada imbricata]|uniref:J domain-containing protein n=1 Tax=Pinctada imbricata TaxID=66713 RepID=A0AA89BR88_PINIB|nr:hypothetical protein FSP39_004187 [Pinctada imbricata]